MAIVLLGFMGVGKSTVGEKLSSLLNLPYIDLDTAIIEKEGKSIPEIFEQYGEAYFRKVEHEILAQYLPQDIVLSTGGGIVENEDNMRLLKENHFNIWLDASHEVIFKRIAFDKNRPNAHNKSQNEIKKLYNSRVSRYNEIAYIKVSNEDDITSCVQQIHNLIMTDDEN